MWNRHDKTEDKPPHVDKTRIVNQGLHVEVWDITRKREVNQKAF